MKVEISSYETEDIKGDDFTAIRVVLNLTAKEALELIESFAKSIHNSLFEGCYRDLEKASIVSHFRDERENASLNGRGDITFVVNK